MKQVSNKIFDDLISINFVLVYLTNYPPPPVDIEKFLWISINIYRQQRAPQIQNPSADIEEFLWMSPLSAGGR